MSETRIRPLRDDEHGWVTRVLAQRWGSPRVVTRGVLHHAEKLPALVAESPLGRIGLATYHIDGDACEIVTLDSLAERQGIGSALLDAIEAIARDHGCRRIWLVTTNDNTLAIRFYQRRGLRLVALHANAIEESRKLKPEIPAVGRDEIPIRDELEFEKLL